MTHSFGRKPNVPDDRDWAPDKLHEHLGIEHGVPALRYAAASTPILDKTIRQAVSDGDPFVTTWKGFLALWKLIKAIFSPKPGPTPPGPNPTPTPTSDGPLWGGPQRTVLDQGAFGTCVGNAWEGACYPHPTEKDARQIYYEATCIGGQCDNPDAVGGGQAGSSTRDGAKAMQKRGVILNYAFATTLAQIEEWLDHHGPVVIGCDWTARMETPDADGTIHYTGPAVGGHEVFLRQNLRSIGKKRGGNSWDGWGLDGDFLLPDADLQKLLDAGGDACLAVGG